LEPLDDCIGEDCLSREENVAALATGFGLIGGLVGALITTERWAEVPAERISVGVVGKRGGAALVVRISF
jgi:hypothetical protein